MDKLPVDLESYGKILFWGVGGSRAYGLADANSDIDYRGVYVAPTLDFFRLSKPSESFVQSKPDDVVFNEIEKFMKLITKGNHNSISDLYNEPQYIGHAKLYVELQRVVPHIVPKIGYFECVRGQANQARKNIERLHMGEYPPDDVIAKFNKEAMHAVRVIDTAVRFMTTRQFSPRVHEDSRDLLLSIKYGDLNPTQLLRVIDRKLRELSSANDISQLRDKANIPKADEMLVKIRRNHEFYK